MNVANRAGGQGPRDVAAPALALAETSEGEVRASLRALDDQVDHGALVPTPPGDYPESRRVALASVPADAWYVAPSELELRCVPTAGQLLTPGGSAAFDRNRCSEAHPGEVLRVVRTSVDGGWQYAHTRHVSGWVRAESLGPRVSPADAALFLRPARRAVLLRDNVDVAPGARLRLGAALPLLELDAGIATVMAPMRDGVGRVRVAWDPRNGRKTNRRSPARTSSDSRWRGVGEAVRLGRLAGGTRLLAPGARPVRDVRDRAGSQLAAAGSQRSADRRPAEPR
ncbi:MAG: SH3 domain-containing protein [Deltaproteobacteria bacterium]|nr:SH3 domain-containing protein [Deltaproteobacteria bacterium]